MTNTFSAGRDGEEAAARFLVKKGYKILERNYRSCGAEIDIIAVKQNYLCFIEVKTRKSDQFGYPQEFVDVQKIRRLERGARIYAEKKAYRNLFKRFDVISVIYRESHYEIKHLDNAFDAQY